MIAYLEGTLLARSDDRIVVLANQVGYEVLVPAVALKAMGTVDLGDRVKLHIYFHQTERQPKPVLIGFADAREKEFFQLFLTVEAIGPLKAVKALEMPVADIARAIEEKNVGALAKLNGIGRRTAQKIIATLEGKLDRFLVGPSAATPADTGAADIVDPVLEVLIEQLGHRPVEARQMIADALAHRPDIQSAEALFDEIYRRSRT